MRFDRRIRLFGSVLFTVGMIVWMPVVIYVPALTFNQVTGIEIHVIAPIVCIICTFYTCVGGLKAVVWTDVIQSFVMFGSIFLVIIKGTLDVGGLGVVLQRNADSGRLNAPEMTLDPTARVSILSVLVGGTLHKIQSSAVNQISIQRFLSLPSIAKVKKTLIVFTIGLTLLLVCCAYVGLLAYAKYYDCDPLSTKLAKATDQLVPLLVMDTLGVFPGLPGLFVCGVVSAALSSLSTGLNSLACVILEDFVKPSIKVPLTDRQTAIILRLVVIFFGLGCIGLVFVVAKLGMVLQLATTLAAITQGPMLGVFTMGICIPWINGKSALTGSIVSFVALSIICVRGQIALVTGEIQFNKMPVSVEGCTYDFDNVTIWNTTREYVPPSEKYFHHMSFLWYTAFGATLCVVTAGLASLVFGTTDTSTMDRALVAPFMHRFMQPKKYVNYFEKRFDRRIRLFGSVLFMFSSMLWLPISVYVPALTFNQVTGINLHIITPVVCGVCTIYTCFGGLKAVVWTDVIQSFVIFGSIAFVMIEGTIRVGGLDVVWQRNMDTGRLSAPEMTLDPTVRMSVLSVFIGGTIFKLQHTAISQPVVQRFLSLPSLDKVKQTLIIFTVGLVTVLSSCVYMGLLTFATYYDCDPLSTKLTSRSDQLVPLLVMQVLGKFPGVPGLFVSGVFSAALSSLSTCLNSMAAVILEDFFKPFSRKPLTERHTAFILRAVVIVFGAFSIVMVYVVEKMGMVLQLSATLQSMTQGPLLGIFTVGMLLPWVSSKSILVGSTTALAIMGWISYKSQVAIITGELTFPKMPVSVEGCTYNYETIPILNSTVYEAPDPGSSKPIYHMSFLWYTLFGVVITIVASGVASLFYGLQDASEIDEILIAPPIRRFIKLYRYDSVDLVEKKVGAYETKKYYDHEKDVNEEGTKCPKEKF